MDLAGSSAPIAKGRMYQPAITRLPSLLCLLLATVGLIALLELACHNLPNADRTSNAQQQRRDIPSVPQEFPRMHIKRNDTVSTDQVLPSTRLSLPQSAMVTPTDGSSSSSSTITIVLPSISVPATSAVISSNETPFHSVSLPINGERSTTLEAPSSTYSPVGPSETGSLVLTGSVYLSVGDQSTIAPSQPNDPSAVYLPVGGPRISAPPITPPATVGSSAYLAVGDQGATVTPTEHAPTSVFLPVGGPIISPPLVSSMGSAVYLPVGDQITTISPPEHASTSIFLPVGGPIISPPLVSSMGSSVYLPIGDQGATVTPTEHASTSIFLPVGGPIISPPLVSSMGSSVYLPVGDQGATVTPTEHAPTTIFLPVGNQIPPTQIPGTLGSSVFLPAGNTGPLSLPPTPTYPVYLPLGGGSSTTAALGPPVYLPVGGVSNPSDPTPGAPIPIPAGGSSTPNPPGAGFEEIPIPQGSSHASTGVVAGVPYSFGTGGSVVIEGSTFMTSTPTTAVLNDGRVAMIGPGGTVAIENSGAGSPGLTTGVAAGVGYTIGPQGSVVIGGLTLQTSSPTTATLPDGQVVVIGPTGDVAIQGLLQPSVASPAIGVAEGLVYEVDPSGVAVVDGQTFQSSHPTTATLSDGHVVVVSPTGAIAIEDSMYTPTPTTGVIDGVPYTIGADGIVMIDGHTFDPSSPMTTTLSDGRIILIGPSGALAINDVKSSVAPTPTTGIADGVLYTIEPDGTVIIEGHTFDPSSPMTTTLSDGHVIVIDPTKGLAIADLRSSNAPTPTTGIADGVPYTIESNGTVLIEGHTFKTSSPTTAALGDGHVIVVGPTGAVSIQDTPAPAPGPVTISIRDYVIGAFLPTLIAVLFSIPWHILSSAIQEMEPIFQLQQADGAPAEKALCLGYKASMTPIATYNAMRNGHFLVWSSGLISLIILLIPPLSSETVFIGFSDVARCTITSSTRQNCYPVLSVYPLAARFIEGILAFVALATLVILIILSRRKSGIYANPMSIAGLATLLQDQRIIEDFRRINSYWPGIKQLESALQGHRYRIGEYIDVDGFASYGLTSVHTSAKSSGTVYNETLSVGKKKYTSVAVTEVEEPLPAPVKRQSTVLAILSHSATVTFFTSMIAGILALVVYYYKNSAHNSFEAFMDSQSFGTNFLFTAIGVFIKIYMTYLDNDLRINQPYRLMSTNPTTARYSILSSPPSNPFAGLFHSLTHADPLSAYLSLTTILCEPLIVALATVPFKATSTFTEFLVATYLTVAILSMLLIALIALLYARWTWHRREGDIITEEMKQDEIANRAPETLAEGLWLLCGSRMRADFRDMALMEKAERDEVVRKWGRVYETGAVVGIDGVRRIGVEEAVLEEVGG